MTPGFLLVAAIYAAAGAALTLAVAGVPVRRALWQGALVPVAVAVAWALLCLILACNPNP